MFCSVRNILRRTGNIFLCGNAEGGGAGVFDLFGPVPLALALHEVKNDGSRGTGVEEDVDWDTIGDGARNQAARKHFSQASLSKDQSEICNLVHGMLLRVAR
jgi:uncharacterized protein (DUF1786 family)